MSSQGSLNYYLELHFPIRPRFVPRQHRVATLGRRTQSTTASLRKEFLFSERGQRTRNSILFLPAGPPPKLHRGGGVKVSRLYLGAPIWRSPCFHNASGGRTLSFGVTWISKVTGILSGG